MAAASPGLQAPTVGVRGFTEIMIQVHPADWFFELENLNVCSLAAGN